MRWHYDVSLGAAARKGKSNKADSERTDGRTKAYTSLQPFSVMY